VTTKSISEFNHDPTNCPFCHCEAPDYHNFVKYIFNGPVGWKGKCSNCGKIVWMSQDSLSRVRGVSHGSLRESQAY
jgi:hypothetical protein